MKIQFISHDTLDPDLVLRLKKEGSDVTLFEEEPTKTLQGSIKKLPFKERMEGPNDLMVYDDVNFGNEPSEMRSKGRSVIGGSEKSDAMELDRMKGIKIAQLAGIQVPKTEQFNKIDDIISFLKKNPSRWVMKQEGDLDGIKGLNFISKVDDSRDLIEYLIWLKEKWVDGLKQTFVLQEFIEGHEVAAGAYWNGTEFMKDKDGDEVCEENWEHKALMAGDMGVATGETFTLMRYRKAKDSKLFMQTLNKMRDVLKKIDFRGNVDINCIICETGVYFLEWTMRFGSPATSAHIAIHKTKWSEFLKACADGKQIPFEFDPRWTIVAWIFTPPFPHASGDLKVNENPKNKDEMKELLEHRISNVEGLVVDFKERLTKEDMNNVHLEYTYLEDGKIKLSNSLGYVFTITGLGDTVEEAAKNTEKLLKKMLVPKGFWRNDFTSHYDKSKEDLIEWGYMEKDSEQEDNSDIEELLQKIKEITEKRVKTKENSSEQKMKKEIEELKKSFELEYSEKTNKTKKEMAEELKKIKDAVKEIIYE